MQRRRILPPPGRSGSPGPGGSRYLPAKTAAITELPYTPDTLISAEESIRDMPMLPICYGVNENLNADGHNDVDARYHGNSRLLALSARRHCIIYPGQFLTGGPPAARIGDRGEVPLRDRLTPTESSPLQRTITEAGLQGGLYGNNMIAPQISLDVSSGPNEWSHSWEIRKPRKKPKRTTKNGDNETTLFF